MEEKRTIITESMNKLDKEFIDKITNTIIESLAASESVDITVLSNVMCMSRLYTLSQGKSTYRYINK